MTWLDDVRAWLMQKSAPLTVHYGRALHPAEADVSTEHLVVQTRHGAVRCELYRPPGVVRPPLLVHLHGGAFIMRHPRMDDFWTRRVAAEAGVAALAIDYAAAPQVRYPVAHEQVYDVLTEVSGRGDELGLDLSRLGLSGFSAGGNLAAAAALQARTTGPRLRFLLLGVPSLDVAEDYADKRPVGHPMLGESILDLVRSTYFKDASRRHETDASPLRAPTLAGLPPTLVVTAERDLLRCEGDAFAARLTAERVPSEHWVVPDRDHYFLDADNAPELLPRLVHAVRSGLDG